MHRRINTTITRSIIHPATRTLRATAATAVAAAVAAVVAAITRRIISPTEDEAEAEAAAAGVPAVAVAVAVAGFAAGGDETPRPRSILSSCFRSQLPPIALIDSDHEMNIHAFYYT